MKGGDSGRMAQHSQAMKDLIYRSVKPHPVHKELPRGSTAPARCMRVDVQLHLGASDFEQPMALTSRSPRFWRSQPVHASLPEDYARRFNTQPKSKPSVLHLDARQIESRDCPRPHRGIGFFPPVRRRTSSLQGSARSTASQDSLGTATAGDGLELVPASDILEKLYSQGVAGTTMLPTEPQAAPTPQHPNDRNFREKTQMFQYVDTDRDVDDLSGMPRPKPASGKKDTSWVYRVKVKKSMNQLSKIMASKTPSVGPTHST